MIDNLRLMKRLSAFFILLCFVLSLISCSSASQTTLPSDFEATSDNSTSPDTDTPLKTETVRFEESGQVLITPPAGWQLESYENYFGPGTHNITLIADSSRKPGCTFTIYAGDRQPAHNEVSFLAYAESTYAQSANMFVEAEPAFVKLDIEDGVAYYFVANYAEFFGEPPAPGRAKVCGMLLLYRENQPIAAASLYVDDPEDPALDLMVKAITEMEMMFPDYEGNTVRFDDKNSVKIDIPSGWGATRERGTYLPGTSRTNNLVLIPPTEEKVKLIITIGNFEEGIMLTKQQFDKLVEGGVSVILPDAVEEEANYNEFQLRGGYGKYCTLTDASLVNVTPGPDEYLYVVVYFAYYDNRSIVYASLLIDDTDSANYQLMLDALFSIEPLLAGGIG